MLCIFHNYLEKKGVTYTFKLHYKYYVLYLLQDFIQLIDKLEGACIRFVHFSQENEVRSRVFAEKMGLEAGWNCHISLRSEEQYLSAMSANISGPDTSQYVVYYDCSYVVETGVISLTQPFLLHATKLRPHIGITFPLSVHLSVGCCIIKLVQTISQICLV